MTFGRDNICEDVWAPTILSYTTASISGFLSLVTIPGNLLICVAMIKDPNKELRTSFNYFVLNLAISDLLVGLVTEPAFVVYHILEARQIAVNEYIWLIHITYFISCMASLQSIAALALDRYLTVTSAYRRKLAPRRATHVSIAIWIVSIGVSQIYFATTFYKFVFIFANVAILTTLGIITFAYIRIYQSLHEHVTQSSSTNQRITARSIEYEKRATRAFINILLIFILCNVPSCIITYAINFCTICKCGLIHWLRDFHFLLTLVNCSANQFLYALHMPTFVRALKSITGISCFEFGARRVGTADEGPDSQRNTVKQEGNDDPSPNSKTVDTLL